MLLSLQFVHESRLLACAVLYSHLHNRGCPSKAIDSTFRTVDWSQRSKMLGPRKGAADDRLFAQHRGCVFSNRNAPGSAELRMETDLSLEELREQGQGRDIFPPCAFFELPRRDISYPCDLLAISMGPPRWA